MAKLGKYSPDLPEWGHDGLVTARNVYYSVAGYRPVKSPSEITTALDYPWLGGGAFEGTGGNKSLLAATTDGLYSFASSAWTKEYPVGAGSFALPWQFAQFGDLVIGVNGAAPVKFTLADGTAADLGGTPPAATMVDVFGDHVLLAGDSSAVKTYTVSALDDAEGWTIGTGGCDEQMLPDGGAITGVAGGEYALVFQSDAIHMLEVADAPLYHTRRKIVSGLGCSCPGSIAQHDRKVFFRARLGFYMFSDGQTVPIGKDRVDATFAATYSLSEIENNLRAMIDPERKLVVWSMNDRLWVYNWEDDAWTVIDVPGLVGIGTGRTASVTLDEIAVLFPSIEDVTPNLDDPFWRGGEPMMLFAKTDGKLYAFGASDNLSATLRKTKEAIAPGVHAHIRSARVETDATAGVTVNLDCFMRIGDSPNRVSASSMRANGDIPIRASGKFVQAEIVMAAGADWSVVSGLDLEATAGGRL